MSSLFLVIIAICLFILSYGSFLFGEKKHSENSSQKTFLLQPSVIFVFLGFLGCTCCSYVISDPHDILIPISSWTIPAVFASSLILLTGLCIFKNKFLQFLLLVVICSANALWLPENLTLTEGFLPVYAEKAILIASWILFTWFYNILNAVDGVLPLQSLSITIGLILMYIIGIMPELYCGWSSVFAVILLGFISFNNYPALISLNDTDCRLIGFFIGWLILLAAIEGNGSCALILSMYYIYETIIALIKKLSFQKRYKNLEDNTFYTQLNALGASPKNICDLIAKINLVLMFLAGFQIYAPNQYTMIFVAFFAVFWMSSRITSPQNNKQHLLLSGSLLSALLKNKKKKSN